MRSEEIFQQAWQTTLNSPNMYLEGFRKGVEAASELGLSGFRKLLLLGVGGSGIVGDIVAALKEPSTQIIVHSHKDITAPAWVGPDTLAVAVSYSGNTAETLMSSLDALSKGARLVAVSSGGRLTKVLSSKGVVVVRVSEGFEPRYAVPEMVGAAYGMLTGLDGFPASSFQKAVEELADFLKTLGRNFGRELSAAESFLNRIVVCVSHSHLAVAAHRLKAQLNENAKHPAYAVLLPEASHNEIEGWTDMEKLAFVFLRSVFQHAIYSDVFDWMRDFVLSRGSVCRDVVIESSGFRAELLKHICYADLVSVALARLKNVNPFELYTIPLLRPRLRKHLP
ncbi:MAG: SIS domain-containing protein [Candidatus Caldarchaeum sp.]